MDSPETSWTLIRDAAQGSDSARDKFSRRYLPVAQAYLLARWRGTHLANEVDDAVQEVFLDCFRQGGVLERAEDGRSGFKAFFGGVIRTIALRTETRRAKDFERGWGRPLSPDQQALEDSGLSASFDREWASAVVREAGDLQAAKAKAKGPEAVRRVELLRLRFHEDLPIRQIAKLWGEDAARLHHEYAQARTEFMEALREIVGLNELYSGEQLDAECARLLSALR